MKSVSAHISGLLGLMMLAASLLPSLHALDHDRSLNDLAFETSLTKSNLDCDLCEFNFSSAEVPDFVNYDLYLPLKESIYSISFTQTVYPFPNSLFALRAPPAMIV
jgi:hypothetical protein